MRCRIETCREKIYALISSGNHRFGFCKEHWELNKPVYQNHWDKHRVDAFAFVGERRTLITDYYDDQCEGEFPEGSEVVIREFNREGLWVAKDMKEKSPKIYIAYNFMPYRIGE